MAELDLDAIEMRGPSPDESNIMCKELRAHRAALVDFEALAKISQDLFSLASGGGSQWQGLMVDDFMRSLAAARARVKELKT